MDASRNQQRTEIDLCHAIITIVLRNLRGAITIRKMARQTYAQVPPDIVSRGWRYASTWWMQQRGDEALNALRMQI